MSTVTAGVYRVGRDAELRNLPNGDPVINLSLASNYGKKDPATGKRPTQWVDGGLFGNMAKNLEPYLKQGQQVFATIEDLHAEEFTRREGGVGYKLTGRISALELVGSPRDQDGQQWGQSRAPTPAPQRTAPAPARPAGGAAGSGFDDMDDDLIPF